MVIWGMVYHCLTPNRADSVFFVASFRPAAARRDGKWSCWTKARHQGDWWVCGTIMREGLRICVTARSGRNHQKPTIAAAEELIITGPSISSTIYIHRHHDRKHFYAQSPGQDEIAWGTTSYGSPELRPEISNVSTIMTKAHPGHQGGWDIGCLEQKKKGCSKKRCLCKMSFQRDVLGVTCSYAHSPLCAGWGQPILYLAFLMDSTLHFWVDQWYHHFMVVSIDFTMPLAISCQQIVISGCLSLGWCSAKCF